MPESRKRKRKHPKKTGRKAAGLPPRIRHRANYDADAAILAGALLLGSAASRKARRKQQEAQ